MVAKVRDLRSSAAAVSYYEKDGYYAKDDPEHRDASSWHGGAAKDLGLRAHVLPREFESVLAGYVPGTEIRLGRMREGEHDHRPGWDITLSAPKSVSLEALVVGDRRVIRAHDDAVRATLDWVEKELLQTRGFDPATRQRPRVAANGMAVAGFRHLTSRGGDPQLHTHCVLANMTRNASGEWRSVEPTRIKRSEKLIGAVYRNELARRLQALGMAVTARMVGRVPGFELAGYDRSFLDAFSGRRAEILAYLKEHNLPYTAKNAEVAALHTRQGKRDIGLAQLVPEWRARARGLGLARDRGALRPDRPIDPVTGERVQPVEVPAPDLPANELRSLRRAPSLPRLPRDAAGERATPGRRSGAPAELSPVPEIGILEAVARSVAHVAERRTAIPEAEIRAVALSHAPGRYTLAEVDGAIDRLVRGGELIEVERRGMDRAFVTDRAVKAERQILASMRAGRGQGKALCTADGVEARLGETRLTRGQQEAVRTVLLSEDRIVGVQGHAGSGKTTMLREVKELLAGRRIQGLAPSAAAARVLGREAGIPSTTLQYFLTRYGDLSDPERLDRARAEYRGAVLAVDESSMIDTVRMEALLRIADRLGVARVALVGDTAQLRAVDAGQPFRLLQKAGMQTATMDKVLRQRDPALLASVMHAREGEAGAAIRGLGAERVREVDREELGAEAARCWLSLEPEDRAETAIMAPTHEIRRQTNEAVREGLAEEGVLHGRALVVDRLVNRRLTRALAADLRSYEPGDIVVFHRDVFGCRANDVCTVMDRHEGQVILAHADGEERRFRPSGNAATYLGLYDSERIELRAGDRIRWTRNRKAPRPRFGHPPTPELVNGGEAAILEIGYKRVRFRDGEREFGLALDDPQLRHLDHAYCTTVHAAQGKTARAAIAVLDAGGAADRALFHVEISRVTDEFLLLTDDREALIELIEARSSSEDGALEALGFDPATIPVVDPEVFAALAADWRAIERRAEETNTVPFFLPGYREVMARAAGLAAIDDLPPDMRSFVDRMLEEHRGHLSRDREVSNLAERIREHWRRWPELGWAVPAEDALPRYDAWREVSEALLEEGRDRLTADGEAARHLHAMPGGRDGLAGALETLERTRVLDDARRFEGLWRELRERAARDAIPELLAEGYGQVAELGARLATAEGLDPQRLSPVEEWRRVHAAQTALAEKVRTLPDRIAAWRERRAVDLPLDERGGLDPADPADPACLAWRAVGMQLETVVRDMLLPEDAHAPYLDAVPGAREAVRQAVGEVRDALDHDRWEGFAWLTREVKRQERETGTEPFHQPRFEEMIAEVRAVSGWAGLSEDEREAVQSWLQYREESARLCQQIRDWPGRADALIGKCPEHPARLVSLREWRHQGEPLLAEARAMQGEDGPHAPHLKAMPPEREALVGATGRLAWALLAVEVREMNLLASVAQRSADETGGIAYDADAYADFMDRVRALDARPGLPSDLRETVLNHLERDEGWTADRKRVGGFLEAARKVDSARNDLDEMARTGSVPAEQLPEWDGWREDAEKVRDKADALRGIPGRELAAHLGAAGALQDAVDKAEEGIAERIARDEAARDAAAEAERQARELARLAAEQAQAAQKAEDERRERDRQRVAGFLVRADELPRKWLNLELAGLDAMARGEQPSGRDGRLRDLREAEDEAKALKADIPGPELAAHERVAGASPGAVDRSAEDFAKRIAEELERQAREQARVAEQERVRAAAEAERQEQEQARIAEQERARAAEERERQEQEQARIAAENARAAELARDAQNEEDERREREAGTQREPHHQAHLPAGTPVALSSLKEGANRDTVFKMLDAVKTSYPDLFFIYGPSMAPAMKFAEEWAQANNVDRVEFKPDWIKNRGFAIAQRDRDIMEAGPIAVVDFTTSAKSTSLTDLAQERNIDIVPVPTGDRHQDASEKALDTDSLSKGRDRSQDRGFSM